MSTALIIVDHGSRAADSNELLETVVKRFRARFWDEFSVVEPAHMELAEPSIALAYSRCVDAGARNIVVVPFFLGPGKHWTTDIPRLAAEAAGRYAGTTVRVAAPRGGG
jgi:sirohydrochlorin ferrochelatase